MHFLPYRGVAFRTTLGEMRLLLKLQPSITKTHPKHSVIIYCKLQWLWNSYWYHHEHHRHHQTIDFQFHLMSQMNEHHDNGLNMCSIKSPNASPFADSINNLSSCSQDIINLIFSNQYYILFPSLIVLLPPWLYLTSSWLLYAAAPGVGHNGIRGMTVAAMVIGAQVG